MITKALKVCLCISIYIHRTAKQALYKISGNILSNNSYNHTQNQNPNVNNKLHKMKKTKNMKIFEEEEEDRSIIQRWHRRF